MLFQSAVITLLTVINIRLVFMKYVPVQIFKTMHHVDSYTETELYMFYSLCYNYYNVKLHVQSSVVSIAKCIHASIKAPGSPPQCCAFPLVLIKILQ